MNRFDEKHAMPITSQEEKEVHRVFELLCDYQQKSKIKQEIEDIKNWINANRNKSHLEHAEENIQAGLNRIDELTQHLHELENKSDKKISCADVMEMLKKLDAKNTKKEVEEMIWEVDENLDGHLDWVEFRLMFNRNITDRTGLEPSRMYNLTQFLIYDTNNNGMVSVDETMNLLYARYGRSTMEQKLKELFGENMQEFGRQGGEIPYSRYIKAVERVQLNMFLETNAGRKAKDLHRSDSRK
mmetsp:Transcript_27546/g.30069  ORF Transcript_27546/g.30069 Transcript_27546/m.30069 type:complete len:242 (+) Transcript_27546:78-803(+)